MLLTPHPISGLVDEPVTWQVDEVPVGSVVGLQVSGTDAAGRRWRSEGQYRVAAGGVLEIDDPDRPWWSMVLLDPHAVPVTFTAPADSWTCTATATCSGGSAEAVLHRLYRSAVDTRELSGDGWQLQVFAPTDATTGLPAVLLVPGSTGMAAMTPTAALLASHGYPTGLLGYMQEPGLPAAMQEIAVEVVTDAIAAFTALSCIDADRVVVWAVSVGTALALSALSGPDPMPVCGVIATSPTNVVWQAMSNGGPPPKTSSLSRAGVGVAWLPIHGERLLGQVLRHAVARHLPGRARSTAMDLHAAFDGEHDPTALAAATIPVERIAGPMLLLAGTADAMWSSVTMAEAIAGRRRAHGVGAGDQVLVLPDAGHFARPPATPTTVDRNADLISGGTPEGIAHGQRAGWDAALAFLGTVTEGTAGRTTTAG